MKILIISSKTYGEFKVFLDDEDWDRVNQYKWYPMQSGKTD